MLYIVQYTDYRASQGGHSNFKDVLAPSGYSIALRNLSW